MFAELTLSLPFCYRLCYCMYKEKEDGSLTKNALLLNCCIDTIWKELLNLSVMEGLFLSSVLSSSRLQIY